MTKSKKPLAYLNNSSILLLVERGKHKTVTVFAEENARHKYEKLKAAGRVLHRFDQVQIIGTQDTQYLAMCTLRYRYGI
jgi:hypothetical protein